MAESKDPHEAPEDYSPEHADEVNSTAQVLEVNTVENIPKANHIDELLLLPEEKPQLVYRCKKCRRIVAGQENVVGHEKGDREPNYLRRKRNAPKGLRDCATIFVEPMKWMQTVEEGYVAEKLYCMGCNSRIGSFNWAGMQCTCGVWVNPAFQLHRTRIDECPL